MLKSSRSLRTSLLPEPLARLEFIRCSETTVPAARAVPPPLREVVPAARAVPPPPREVVRYCHTQARTTAQHFITKARG
jgi:hypothetical protein